MDRGIVFLVYTTEKFYSLSKCMPVKKKVKTTHVLAFAALAGSTVLASATNVALFGKDCTSDSTRPCYEEQINKIKRVSEKKAAKEFINCTKKASSEYGTISVSTAICADEMVKYCTTKVGSGKGNDRSSGKPIKTIRKFDGTCASTEPLPPPPPSIPDITATIQAPVGGRGWVRGTTLPIKSSYTGTFSTGFGSVGARLLKGGVTVRDIVVPAQGMPYSASLNITWPIPLDLEPSADYAVEIFYGDRPDIKAVSGQFSILGETLHVYGKVFNKFTGAPIPDIKLSSGGQVITVATDGSYTLDQTTGQWGLSTQNKACYLQSTSYSGPYNIPGGSYWIYRYVTPEPHDLNEVKPVLGPEIEHNIPVWPGVDFSVKSDIAVSLGIEYGTTNNGPGNSNYRTEHYLSFSFPLDYDVRVHLTDQAGNIYTSPYYRLPRDHGCGVATLTFTDGQFMWK